MPATARPTQAHSHAGWQARAKPKLYNPSHPERTLLDPTIAEHFETCSASAGQCAPGQANRAHVCAVDGVFEQVAGDTDAQSLPADIVFHPASAIDETAVAQVQADLRRRILRAFVGRGLIEKADAKEMLAYQHSGFSVDAGVLIEADDRAALERLLRYCARPPFACERLRKEGAALVYRCAKQHSEPGSDKRDAKVDELHLRPLELIASIAALVPPPRTHRHRYFGVLAPNSPHRAAVTVFAAPMQQATAEPAQPGTGVGVPGVVVHPPAPEPVAPPKRSKAHYLWAVLIARI